MPQRGTSAAPSAQCVQLGHISGDSSFGVVGWKSIGQMFSKSTMKNCPQFSHTMPICPLASLDAVAAV